MCRQQGRVSKLGRTGRIEFSSEGAPPHVLLRGHFRAQIGLSAQADKRPIQSNGCVQNELEVEAGERRTAFKTSRMSGDKALQAGARPTQLNRKWTHPNQTSLSPPPVHPGAGEEQKPRPPPAMISIGGFWQAETAKRPDCKLAGAFKKEKKFDDYLLSVASTSPVTASMVTSTLFLPLLSSTTHTSLPL